MEFVSANPTGDLHLGHARGAAYGDAVARMLIKQGHEVIKEYYINDDYDNPVSFKEWIMHEKGDLNDDDWSDDDFNPHY